MKRMSMHTALRQISELAPTVSSDLCAISTRDGVAYIGHRVPVKVLLPFAGIGILEEVELPLNEVDEENSIQRVFSWRIHERDKPELLRRAREARRKAQESFYRNEVEPMEREMRKDLKNAWNDRVVSSGSGGDSQWHR